MLVIADPESQVPLESGDVNLVRSFQRTSENEVIGKLFPRQQSKYQQVEALKSAHSDESSLSVAQLPETTASLILSWYKKLLITATPSGDSGRKRPYYRSITVHPN